MLRIYHNPRCSKSRQALALLREAGHEPEVVKYLETPPDEAALRRVLAKLDTPAAGLLRHNEPQFKELGLADRGNLNQQAVIDALVAAPKLLQRPLIETDERAFVARPPERVSELGGPRR
ncbi:arsenate reductase (glutaredoxin) [Salinisphaera sp. PC39]|uniref:arsenate reductase (glutaredoxin) n=1 Tax=Salinisphaera sp. PC39 TaxID=1304156 RepID=UPI0033423B8E